MAVRPKNGITTSGVSQQIKALEKDLGVVLLHRSTRKLSLTEAGLDLLGFAQNIVKSAQDAKDSISQILDDWQKYQHLDLVGRQDWHIFRHEFAYCRHADFG